MYTSRLSQCLNSKNFGMIEQCLLPSNLPNGLVHSITINGNEAKFNSISKERILQNLNWPNKFFFEVFKRLLAVKKMTYQELSLEQSLQGMVALFKSLARQSVMGKAIIISK